MGSKFCRYFALLALQVTLCCAFEIQYQCKLDSDCGLGSFCHNFLCERCIPCEQLFNRFSPSLNGCAKREDDCGRCFLGYQAEDLTSQRRSMKCFPVASPPAFVEKPTTFLPPSDLIYGTIGLIVVTVVVFMIVAGVFIRAKGKPIVSIYNSSGQNAEQKLMEDGRLPPPYESSQSSYNVGLPRTSQYSYTLVLPEQDILNHATPFEPYHSQKRRSIDFETDLHVADDSPTLEDGTGSTETIPSLWEPSAGDELSAESPEQTTDPPQRNSLARSYSFDSSPRFIGTNQSSESRSDPVFNGRLLSGGQSYAHRHVQLSMFRSISRNASSPESGTNSRWNSDLNIPQECRIDEILEPSAPQSFVFDESPAIEGAAGGQHSNFLTRSLHFFLAESSWNAPLSENAGEHERGSQDSGFFDHARRRPATEELEFGVAFYIKRSRQFD